MIFCRLKSRPSRRTAIGAFEDEFHRPGEPYVPYWHEGKPRDEYDPDIEYYLSDRLLVEPERHWDYIYPEQILPWQAEWLRRDRSISVANIVSAVSNYLTREQQPVSRNRSTFLTSGPTGPEILEWFFRQRRRELQQQLQFMSRIQLVPRPELSEEDTDEEHHHNEDPNAFEQAAPAEPHGQPRTRRPVLPRWLRNEISLTQYHREPQETLRLSNHPEGGTQHDGEQLVGENWGQSDSDGE